MSKLTSFIRRCEQFSRSLDSPDLKYIISQRTDIKHAVAEEMMEENDLGRWEGNLKGRS